MTDNRVQPVIDNHESENYSRFLTAPYVPYVVPFIVVLFVCLVVNTTLYTIRVKPPKEYIFGSFDSEITTREDDIHIIMTVCNGGDDKEVRDQRRYQETRDLLQTMQNHGIDARDTKPIQVHLFADEPVTLSKFLNESLINVSKLNLNLYNLITVTTSKNLDINLFRPCASARLYTPLLFQNANSSMPKMVLYLDTDVLITKPLRSLWTNVSISFERHQKALFSLAQECMNLNGGGFWYKGVPGVKVTDDTRNGTQRVVLPYPKGTCGLNSGVMVAHLDRWVQFNFVAMVQEQVAFAAKHKLQMPYGDQGILNAMVSRFRERWVELPCNWNVRTDTYEDCLKTYRQEGGGIVHGNRAIFYRRNLNPLFKELLEYFINI